jgi:hypothetical protein
MKRKKKKSEMMDDDEKNVWAAETSQHPSSKIKYALLSSHYFLGLEKNWRWQTMGIEDSGFRYGRQVVFCMGLML